MYHRTIRNWPATVQERLIRRGIARQLYDLRGDDEARYIPTPAELKSTPTAGEFYHVRKGNTVSAIARAAYGDGGKVGQLRINNATWNGHVEKAVVGWTHLKIKGLQLLARYAGPPAPRAGKGSGKSFPVLWIPPISGAEPEAVKKPKAPAAVAAVVVPKAPAAVVVPKAPAAVVKPKAPAVVPKAPAAVVVPKAPAAVVKPKAPAVVPKAPAAVVKPKAPAVVVPKAPAAVVVPKAPAYEPVEPSIAPAAVVVPKEPAAVEVTRPITIEPEFVPMVPVKAMDESGIAAGAILALLIL